MTAVRISIPQRERYGYVGYFWPKSFSAKRDRVCWNYKAQKFFSYRFL